MHLLRDCFAAQAFALPWLAKTLRYSFAGKVIVRHISLNIALTKKRPPRLAMAFGYMIDFCKSSIYSTANSERSVLVMLVTLLVVVPATMLV